jgi:hypothetical protein
MKREVFCNWPSNSILNCNDHFQLILFLHYKWYKTSHMSCKSCNSPYIWCNSIQLIIILLQFCQNNSFSTIMQVHYNYSHNIILTLLIFIHSLNLTCGTMRIFGCKIFIFIFEYWSTLFIMIINDGLRLWHVTQLKNCHMAY